MSDLVERLRDADTTRRIGESYADTHERRQRDREEAATRIAQLEAALRYALENSGGTQYWGDDDDCGTHSCCGEVSYKPHAADCWTVIARAALGEERT